MKNLNSRSAKLWDPSPPNLLNFVNIFVKIFVTLILASNLNMGSPNFISAKLKHFAFGTRVECEWNACGTHVYSVSNLCGTHVKRVWNVCGMCVERF
jgi:hypothetical protein